MNACEYAPHCKLEQGHDGVHSDRASKAFVVLPVPVSSPPAGVAPRSASSRSDRSEGGGSHSPACPPFNGKFGPLSLEQSVYLNAIARAFKLAPLNADEWALSMLRKTLWTECERFGVSVDDVLASVHPSVEPIDDEMRPLEVRA